MVISPKVDQDLTTECRPFGEVRILIDSERSERIVDGPGDEIYDDRRS